MGLRSVFAAALPSVFANMGEAAVYTPFGGAAIACHIFIDFAVSLQPDGLQAQTWDLATVVECLLSEVVSEPNRGATFVYDETTYTVQRVLSNDGFTVKMAVT